MFSLDYSDLQHYWWAIVSLLGALLVFLLFVQGGQSLIFNLAKNKEERTILLNATGRKWELTFTTLVTFGGAFFAAFPLFYSTSFGGAYWVWMAILFAFIIQAVSYEYRSKENNFLGAKTFETFLFLNGVLGSTLLGVAVSTFFTGSQFSVNKMNLIILNSPTTKAISAWETPFHGLEALWTVENGAFLQNISLGLAVFFLARVLALLYFQGSIQYKSINDRLPSFLIKNTIPFLVFFLFWLIRLQFIDGFAINPNTKEIFMKPHKYLHNFLEMPILTVILLIGIALVLTGIALNLFKKSTKGIWFSGAGTILTVWALLLSVGYNNTAYYPSTFNIQNSLTIENSSSTEFTLSLMGYVSLLVPFVMGYVYVVWKKIDSKPITKEEINSHSGGHIY